MMMSLLRQYNFIRHLNVSKWRKNEMEMMKVIIYCIINNIALKESL